MAWVLTFSFKIEALPYKVSRLGLSKVDSVVHLATFAKVMKLLDRNLIWGLGENRHGSRVDDQVISTLKH